MISFFLLIMMKSSKRAYNKLKEISENSLKTFRNFQQKKSKTWLMG